MLVFFVSANAQVGAWDQELEEKSQEIISMYQDTNSTFKSYFEDEVALDRYNANKVEFAGQASAIAVSKGASADIAYKDGIAVYTMPKSGLMLEASLGGQKFKFVEKEE